MEIRNEVREKLSIGEKPKKISEQMGISLPTIYKWKKEFKGQAEQKEKEIGKEAKRKQMLERRKEKLNKEKRVKEGKASKDEIETSKNIEKLIRIKRFEEAIKLTDKYPYDLVIQSQRIKILIIKKKYEEAKNVGKRFIDNAPIQSQMRKIVEIESKRDEIQIENIERNGENARQEELKVANKEQQNIQRKQFLNKIKTKIYYNKIDKEDIEEIEKNSEISEYERMCVLLAIYERKRSIQKAKQLVKKYKTDNPKSKFIGIFNIIMQRIESNETKIFDQGFYDELLDWVIDVELKKRYEQEGKEENRRKIELERKNRKEKENEEEEETKKVKNRETKTNSYATTQKNESTFKNRIKVSRQIPQKPIQEKKREEPNHFKEISEYIREKRKLIYIKIQSEDDEIRRIGIEQWDKMESLLEKVKENRKNKEYLTPLYKKIVRLREIENSMNR